MKLKQLKIMMFGEDDSILNNVVKLESNELDMLYYNDGKKHGLQSKYNDYDERHQKQIEICAKISDLVRELEKISLSNKQ